MNATFTVRYRCIGTAHELQKHPNGSGTLINVFVVTLVPSPAANNYVHGTPLKLGFYKLAAIQVGDEVDLLGVSIPQLPPPQPSEPLAPLEGVNG